MNKGSPKFGTNPLSKSNQKKKRKKPTGEAINPFIIFGTGFFTFLFFFFFLDDTRE